MSASSSALAIERASSEAASAARYSRQGTTISPSSAKSLPSRRRRSGSDATSGAESCRCRSSYRASTSSSRCSMPSAMNGLSRPRRAATRVRYRNRRPPRHPCTRAGTFVPTPSAGGPKAVSVFGTNCISRPCRSGIADAQWLTGDGPRAVARGPASDCTGRKRGGLVSIRRLQGILGVFAFLGSALVTVGSSAGPALAKPAGWTVTTRAVAHGMKLLKLVRSSGPTRAFVLTVDRSSALSVDVGLAARWLGGFERTSSQAKRYGAIAAINGDFAYWTGRPMHPFLEDGYLRYTSTRQGQNFGFAADEHGDFMGQPKVTAWASIPRAHTTLPLTSVNDGAPLWNRVVETSPVFSTKAPDHSCTARLRSIGDNTWTNRERATAHPYRVVAARCD